MGMASFFCQKSGKIVKNNDVTQISKFSYKCKYCKKHTFFELEK